MSLVVVILPLGLGIASIRWGNAAFGYGLWVSSGWFVLNRLQYFVGGRPPPWTKEMAVKLQILSDDAEKSHLCCNWTSPYWGITGVYCANCNKVLSNMPRPDLGRKRSDRWPLGFFRLLLSDGYPIMSFTDQLDLREEE